MKPGNFLVLMILLAAASCGTPPPPDRRLTEDERTMWGRMNAVQPPQPNFQEPWPNPGGNTAREPRFPRDFPARR